MARRDGLCPPLALDCSLAALVLPSELPDALDQRDQALVRFGRRRTSKRSWRGLTPLKEILAA